MYVCFHTLPLLFINVTLLSVCDMYRILVNRSILGNNCEFLYINNKHIVTIIVWRFACHLRTSAKQLASNYLKLFEMRILQYTLPFGHLCSKLCSTDEWIHLDIRLLNICIFWEILSNCVVANQCVVACFSFCFVFSEILIELSN